MGCYVISACLSAGLCGGAWPLSVTGLCYVPLHAVILPEANSAHCLCWAGAMQAARVLFCMASCLKYDLAIGTWLKLMLGSACPCMYTLPD